MNTEYFISKRLFSKDKANFSYPIIRVAIISIALSIAVMIVSVAIVTGFKKEIRDKVIGFNSHIQIGNYDLNSSYETKPVSKKQNFYPSLNTMPGIKHIQVFALKAGIIKTADQIEGVVLKGVGSDYNWDFFKERIVKGTIFKIKANDSIKSDKIVISKYLSSKLKIKVGDDVVTYFIQQPPRMRKFKVCGIYETGFEEFDKMYAFIDIAHIQKLNDWDKDQVGGFEVYIDNFNDLDKWGKYIYKNISYNLNSSTVKQLNPQIFDWLDLQDMNVVIILALMLLVATITMISTLLILIIEKTSVIGILKALGYKNGHIRKIFLYNAFHLLSKGLLWGNAIALLICIIQYKFHLLKLPQESYFMSFVPVNLDILNILYINLGTIIICLLILIIPSYIITRISPVRAIRFD